MDKTGQREKNRQLAREGAILMLAIRHALAYGTSLQDVDEVRKLHLPGQWRHEEFAPYRVAMSIRSYVYGCLAWLVGKSDAVVRSLFPYL